MDNLTANKSCIPSQSWGGQDDWSITSTQTSLLNTPPDSQHLSLGSSSDQTPSYDHLQMSSQSCHRTLSSGNNTHHSNLFKASHISSNPSSTTLFTDTAIPSTSNTMSYDQQSCHNSSLLLAANQGNTMQTPALHQQGQGLQPQHLPFLSDNNPYKESFQPPETNEGLPGLQDLPTSLPACVSTAHAPFEGANVESAGYSHTIASSSFQEQPQWTPSSHCRGKLDLLVMCYWVCCLSWMYRSDIHMQIGPGQFEQL